MRTKSTCRDQRRVEKYLPYHSTTPIGYYGVAQLDTAVKGHLSQCEKTKVNFGYSWDCIIHIICSKYTSHYHNISVGKM